MSGKTKDEQRLKRKNEKTVEREKRLEEGKMREEEEEEGEAEGKEEERWEVGDLFLPQYLTRLSSTWNNITAGFCGNLARSCTCTRRHRHSTCCGGKLNVFRPKLKTFILLNKKKGSKEKVEQSGLGPRPER